MIPLSLEACSVAERAHCGARNDTALQHVVLPTNSSHPALYVAMATIPPRVAWSRTTHSAVVRVALQSLREQTRAADAVLLSVCQRYHRFPATKPSPSTVDIMTAMLGKSDDVEILGVCDDQGPGTKLLCALPRLRALATASQDAWAVMLDDDLKYKRWALQLLERAIMDDHREAPSRHAYSYDVYTLTSDGRAVVGGLEPGLLVGSGHALFAVRISLLDGFEDFAACVQRLEARSFYHDDVVVSMFLQDVRGVMIHRLGGTPFEAASKGCLPNSKRYAQTPQGRRAVTCRVRVGSVCSRVWRAWPQTDA